jgi:hypothetical protein
MTKTKNEVAKTNSYALDQFGVDQVPDFMLKDEGDRAGLEALRPEDMKRSRIMLLQALSPQVAQHRGQAIPGDFWHNIANMSIGNQFAMVVLNTNRRVILWKPRHEGGGILAFSRNGLEWDSGGNQTFHIKPDKDSDRLIPWNTGKNVHVSKLTQWGTYDPTKQNSPPAASTSYEYLVYLPDFPELSPVVISLYKTALGNARSFNTLLYGLRRPVYCCGFICSSTEVVDGNNRWFVPQFESAGFIKDKALYDTVKKLHEENREIEVDYSQDEMSNENNSNHNKLVDDDAIKF